MRRPGRLAPNGVNAPQGRGYNIYEMAARKLALLAATVAGSGLHLVERLIDSQGRALVILAGSLANLVTGHRNIRRRRIHRIVVHQMKAICSLDARK